MNRGEKYQLIVALKTLLFNIVTKSESNGNIPKTSVGEVVWINRHNAKVKSIDL